MTANTIRTQSIGRLSIITIRRHVTSYSQNERMVFALKDSFAQLSQDEGTWVIIITGTHNTFLKSFDLSSLPHSTNLLSAISVLKCSNNIALMQKPVIAALNGDILDQGLELALACDIRVASIKSIFGLTQINRGLIPWDGGTQRLSRLIGKARALEMILSPLVIPAKRALDIGLVNEIVEPPKVLDSAIETASSIIKHGPIAARYLKEAIYSGLDMKLDQGLRLENDLGLILQNTTDRQEGINSFLKGRDPKYKGK